ncbi:hypothetical protein [Chitinophaga barathri]|uniref:Uncharacterized protein n=1 Tax=Chitinophaga barathri TaxID=1647451 RepID=A0A3N4M6C8_9BACT|nr:hypothetical protein [Chitinophaga barathri]RPD38914.1 hypothetical protein EG028_22455 [Chitinophaga barathri]
MDEVTHIFAGPPEMKSQDFAFLREEGMKLLRSVASASWTDHNLHDPGITLLEACCYAITEMGLRSGMPMRDLLASDANGRSQDFVTAANILPVAPITQRDIRKILIDHPMVQNAWVFPLESEPAGKIKVLLEFADKQLNSNNFAVTVLPPLLGFDVEVDVALPFWDEEEALPFSENVTLQNVTFQAFAPGVFWTPIEGTTSYFARITVQYQPSVGPVTNRDLTVVAQINTQLADPLAQIPLVLNELMITIDTLGDNSPADQTLLKQYNRWVTRANNAMKTIQRHMAAYRNLCEDFTAFKAVRLQEVAVTANIDVNAGVILEELLADILLSIDRYITPVNLFRGLTDLQQVLEADDIFEGPQMATGFLPDDALTATNLPEHVFTSDILRLILQHRDQRGTDVEQREDVTSRRISAVRNLNLALFMDNRVITTNARDALCLINSQQHIPHLSPTKSKIVFYRNGLAMPYDLNQAITMFEERKQEQLNSPVTGPDDIALPTGDNYPVSSYYPIQQDLPVVYGVGYAGLPDSATLARRGQALQLQGYLFFFEQLTAGLASQLGNLNAIFSAAPDEERTIFQQPLYNLPQIEQLLRGYNPGGSFDAFKNDENNSYRTALRQASESKDQFLIRRNRVLNHLLAMFGEDMYDTTSLAYHEASIVPNAASLLLPQLLQIQQAQRDQASQQLIREKSAFFRDLPSLSRHRAQSFGNPVWNAAHLLQIFPTQGAFGWNLLDASGAPVLRHAAPVPSESIARMNAATAMALAKFSTNFSTQVEGASLRVLLKAHPEEDAVAISPAVFPNPAAATVAINAAVDAMLQHWRIYSLTPLERRLHHLLEVVVKERRPLLFLPGVYFEIYDEPPPIQKMFRLWSLPGFAGVELLRSTDGYTAATDPLAVAAAEAAIQTTISRGLRYDNFVITQSGPNFFGVELRLQDGTPIAEAPAVFATMAQAKTAVMQIWQHLHRFMSAEGFYMAEHLLLAPKDLPITQLVIPEVKDPYSFQVTFVFPSGYAQNFSGGPRELSRPEKYRDPEFRKHSEQQVRKSCPSHILPRVLWVDRELPAAPANSPGFGNFETRYRAWQEAWIADETNETVIRPLRNSLVTMLNLIYEDLENG